MIRKLIGAGVLAATAVGGFRVWQGMHARDYN
jgi:hypothetical protein